jgi:hypothetical protein
MRRSVIDRGQDSGVVSLEVSDDDSIDGNLTDESHPMPIDPTDSDSDSDSDDASLEPTVSRGSSTTSPRFSSSSSSRSPTTTGFIEATAEREESDEGWIERRRERGRE